MWRWRVRWYATGRMDVAEMLMAALANPLVPPASPRLCALFRSFSWNDKDALADRMATGATRRAKQRASELFYAALGADREPRFYDRWLDLHTRLGLTAEGIAERPFESEEDRASGIRLAEAMAKAMARDELARTPATAPDAVILSAPVWIDALRIPEGPPVELQNLLKKHGVTILGSEALLGAIDDMLQQLGWDDDARATARARVEENTVDRNFVGADTDAALAHAAWLDSVYTVGPDSGQSRDGIAFRPVHELLSLLRRV